MAAEIRVDTIKSRAGINTLFFGGDTLSFENNVGIGTTIAGDPITTANNRKLAVGIVTAVDQYVGLITANRGAGYSYVNVGTGVSVVGIATFHDTVRIAGITTFASTSHVKIPSGTTGQRPSPALAGDFRYNTTDGKFEGYTDEWGEIGGGGGATETDVAVSSTSATAVYTVAHATYRSVYMVIQITQGSAYQVGRYLVIHDGTTASIVEEAAIATGSMLGTFTAGIDGSNLKVYVNMGSASSATVTVLPNPVTV